MKEQINYALVDLRGPDQIGEAIRLYRKSRGLTQQQLADRAGCSIMFVSNVERGKDTAEIGKVLSLLEVLDVEITLSDRKARNA